MNIQFTVLVLSTISCLMLQNWTVTAFCSVPCNGKADCKLVYFNCTGQPAFKKWGICLKCEHNATQTGHKELTWLYSCFIYVLHHLNIYLHVSGKVMQDTKTMN